MEYNSRYRQFVADAIQRESAMLAARWLKELENVVLEAQRDTFPTDEYLDHIPDMIAEIAQVIRHPKDEFAFSNSVIDRKSIQLGTLRHEQKASVSQLLREYEILAIILEQYVTQLSDEYQGELNRRDLMSVASSTGHIVRSILKVTVDTFVEKYTATIQDKTAKIQSFNDFISHELNTPLQSALLNTELLLEDKSISDEETKGLLKIQASIQQTTQLLRNIQNLSLSPQIDPTDNPVQQHTEISALVKDIKNQLDEGLKEKDVEMQIAGDLGAMLIDTAKLKLILSNLLINACKYSDPKKNRRTITVESATTHDNKHLVLSIADNGLGIAPEMQTEVFKLRVRAHRDKDGTHEVSGHGVGLFLVAEAVRDLNGKIELKSTLNQGTTVEVSLPYVQSL